MSLSNSGVVKRFLDGGQKGRSGNMSIEGNVLYSYSLPITAMLIDGKGKWLLINGDSSSVTTNGHIGQVLGYAYSRKDLRQTPIPFSAMQSAGILSSLNHDLHDAGDKATIHLIDAKKDTWEEVTNKDGSITRKHTLGGCVFFVDPERNYYLSGIDSSSKNYRGNFFLVQLPNKMIDTFEEGLNTLRPQGITENAKRQGEFFFEPTNKKTKDLTKIDKSIFKTFSDWIIRGEDVRIQLQTYGKIGLINRHSVESNLHIPTELRINMDMTVYVRGTVRHIEHKMLKLNKVWHRVYENMAINSWQANGGFD